MTKKSIKVGDVITFYRFATYGQVAKRLTETRNSFLG
jgi:hypothetical protein